MNVKFGNEELNCRSMRTMPTHFRLNDMVVGPEGILLKVVTVQKDCPIWESTRKTKCVVIFQTEKGQLIPTDSLHGSFQILRPRYA